MAKWWQHFDTKGKFIKSRLAQNIPKYLTWLKTWGQISFTKCFKFYLHQISARIYSVASGPDRRRWTHCSARGSAAERRTREQRHPRAPHSPANPRRCPRTSWVSDERPYPSLLESCPWPLASRATWFEQSPHPRTSQALAPQEPWNSETNFLPASQTSSQVLRTLLTRLSADPTTASSFPVEIRNNCFLGIAQDPQK